MLNIIGNVSSSKEKILSLFEKGEFTNLVSLNGEYILVFEKNRDVTIVSSRYGMCQYYYTLCDRRFFHGETITNLIQDAQLKWEYNHRTLATLAILGHTLASETLHKNIHRIPARSILSFKDGKLSIETLTWENIHINRKPFLCTPQNTLLAFNKACELLVETENIISISGGYDSRLILSFFLQKNLKPYLLVMGNQNSTDVTIAKKIAKHYKLDIEVISLELKDYFDSAMKIVELTGGTKTFQHWHSYIYTKKSNIDRSLPLFVGSNGEFARLYYTDKIPLIYIADMMSPFSLPLFWILKLKIFLRRQRKCFRDNELHMLTPELSRELDPTRIFSLITKLSTLCNYQLLAGCDKFYLEQRVRTLIANGLKLMSASYRCKSPFLDSNWISYVCGLSIQYKRHSSWHKYAIRANKEELLKFEFEDNINPIVPYAHYPDMLADCQVIKFIKNNASLISDLIDPGLIDTILAEHQSFKSRTSTISFLLTQIYWKILLREKNIL